MKYRLNKNKLVLLVSAAILAQTVQVSATGKVDLSHTIDRDTVVVESNSEIDLKIDLQFDEIEKKDELLEFDSFSEELYNDDVMEDELSEEIYDTSNEDISEDYFIAMDEEGNVEYIPIEEMDTVDQELLDTLEIQVSISSEDMPQLMSENEVATISSDINHGIVIFKNRTGYVNTEYTDAKTGASGYTNGAYGPDAAYLGMQDGKVKFMLSGVTGLVDASLVQVLEYDAFIASGMVSSVYQVSNGRFYHKITTNLSSYTSTQIFGYQQSYMQDGKVYYSYDGHYFYESYKVMVTDYKNGNYNNSINKDNPYYNYYLYLSHRSKTSYTANQMNSYLESKTSSTTSKMLNSGQYFIDAQNAYGANAGLMFGLAINESGYGTSVIAQDKNNLFGHGAVDSNPYYGANGYSSVKDSINYHAQYFVSRQYLNAVSDFRYFGAHLGNKCSGMNVKYASDPYWGEKAAAHSFLLEDFDTSSVADYENYAVGLLNTVTDVYNEPNQQVLYQLKNKSYNITYNIPVIIQSTVEVDGVKWYKVSSDIPLAADRLSTIAEQTYSYSKDYVYIKQENVSKLLPTKVQQENEESNSNTDNNNQEAESNENQNESADDKVEEEEEVETIMLGDVNDDGNISALDYMLVKNHIMGSTTLKDKALSAADANKDGNISALDYMTIKNHIMGVSTIQ